LRFPILDIERICRHLIVEGILTEECIVNGSGFNSSYVKVIVTHFEVFVLIRSISLEEIPAC
jgi:hypothetical protein